MAGAGSASTHVLHRGKKKSRRNVAFEKKIGNFQFFAGHLFDKNVVLQEMALSFMSRKSRSKIRSVRAIFLAAYCRHNGTPRRGSIYLRRYVRADLREYAEKGILPYYIMSTYWHRNSLP